MPVGKSLNTVGLLDFGVIKYLKTSIKRQDLDHWEKWIQQEELSFFLWDDVPFFFQLISFVIYDNFKFWWIKSIDAHMAIVHYWVTDVLIEKVMYPQFYLIYQNLVF